VHIFQSVITGNIYAGRGWGARLFDMARTASINTGFCYWVLALVLHTTLLKTQAYP